MHRPIYFNGELGLGRGGNRGRSHVELAVAKYTFAQPSAAHGLPGFGILLWRGKLLGRRVLAYSILKRNVSLGYSRRSALLCFMAYPGKFDSINVGTWYLSVSQWSHPFVPEPVYRNHPPISVFFAMHHLPRSSAHYHGPLVLLLIFPL